SPSGAAIPTATRSAFTEQGEKSIGTSMSGDLSIAPPFSTPKAFANFSPGLERSDNPGTPITNKPPTLKGFAARETLSGFNAHFLYAYPGFSLRSNPGLKLANAFGVSRPGLN